MNEFKEKNKVIQLTEEERKRNESIDLIISFYNGDLSPEEEKKILEIDKEILPSPMYYTLFCLAKEYIETGKVSEETYIKCMQTKKQKVILEEVPEKWQKAPEK